MYHLLRGLSHSIPEVKESCASALMVVLDLDDIQQYKLKKYLVNEEVNHQNRSTGETHHDTKLVNVLERFANISDHEFHGSTFKQDDCKEEVERIKQWLKKKNGDALNPSGDSSDTKNKKISNELKEFLVDKKPLVETPTMKKNLDLVLGVVKNPAHLLLEGETGVGKTAVITEAARRKRVPLIRLNLSSSTTIMSLFGSAFPKKVGETIEVEFNEGFFTKAFRLGAWLLLDEFNLAPDNVLSSIESALDTSTLVLSTDSIDSSEPENDKKYLEIPQHADFRLFCTQNPNSGLFKGKRENHSSSLLSRFTPIIIDPPNKEEINTILQEELQRNYNGSDCLQLAKKLSNLHESIIRALHEMEEFKSAHAKLTLRDAIKLVESVTTILQGSTDASQFTSKIGHSACSIYASRLRQSQNRDKIRNIINESFHLENFSSVGLHSGDVLQGNISSLNISSSSFTLKENSIKAQTREGSESYFELTAKDLHSVSYTHLTLPTILLV